MSVLDAPAGGSTRSTSRATTAGAGATSTAPTGRDLWRSARAPLAVAAVLLLVAVVLGVLRTTGSGGRLDPRSYAPQGSRALAVLLQDRGVPVRVVTDLPQLRAELGPRSTVLVPLPQALTEGELAALGELDRPPVVLEADEPALEALDVEATVAEQQEVDVRRPACDLPAAQRAGAATAGGVTYQAQDRSAPGCYAVGGRPTLLALPDAVLLGAADPLTNEELAEEGNAALALGLLGGGDEVLWLLPRAGRETPGERPGLADVVPDAVPLGALQLGVAVVLLALWRARRLGPVVEEPLPVVVRAAEAVEGRSRLYRAAQARDVAAEQLRAGARDRLSRRLGLPPDADRAQVVQTLAARAGQDPARADALLYGPAPADDAALVRLADDLDRLRP